MMKKFLVMIMVSVLSISCIACSGKSNEKEKDTTETTSTEEKVTTTKKEEVTSQEEESTTKEEKPTITPEGISIDLDTGYPFLEDYKDFVIEYFNNKSFKKGDTFDCKAEIETLGLDVNEYGKIFSAMYSRLVGASQNCNFTEGTYIMDEMFLIPLVDSNNNYTGTNNTEQSFHLEISFDKPDVMSYYVVFD